MVHEVGDYQETQKRRYKVLHLITHLGPGGAQDNTLLTVEGLDRSRFEVHLAAASGAWEPRGRAAADRFFLVPSLRREVIAGSHISALRDIYALLKRERYHIIHTHSTHAGILGRVAAKIARTPIVIHTVHGFAFDDWTLSPRVRAALILLERFCARLTDRLIMVSKLNKEEALALRIAPEQKMVVIYSGIDLSRFPNGGHSRMTRSALGLEGHRRLVGWVGRLSEQNAPEVFIEVARRVSRARPDVQFLMAGDGPLECRCRELAAAIPQLTLMGHCSDVPGLLPLFDVFVSTVRWAGLGRAVTEAMIAGRPVIATSVNGVPEIVRHGETGLLVPPDEPQEVERALCYLLDHPEEASRLGENARACVVPEFGADLMVGRITKLYDDLLTRANLA